MAFKILYGDICKMKSEAIVNSLGIDARVFGQVCKNIVEKANSEEIYKLVSTKRNNNIFDIFITDAGRLKAEHIIHIVSPFKHQDDRHKSALKKAYKLVIEEAIKRGYKSIAIPFLGTGANGYEKNDVYEAATTVAKDYMSDDDNSSDIIDITFVIYDKESYGYNPYEIRERRFYKLRNNEAVVKNGYYDDIIKNNTYSLSKSIIDSMEMNRIFDMVNKDEMFIPEDYVTCVVDFIDSYMKQHNIRPIELHSNGVSKDKMSKCRLGKRIFKKYEIYRTGVILGWNRTVFLQAMSIAGYSFSALDDGDILFHDYLLKGKLIDNFLLFWEEYPELENILFDKIR